MVLRTLWNVLRSPERRSTIFSQSSSPVLRTIYQSFEEQRQIIDRLRRYEDITYGRVARHFAFLRHELAAIFRATPEG